MAAIQEQDVRLSKRDARIAARNIDDLLLPLGWAIDYANCLLMGVRGRVLSKCREVPSAVWADVAPTLAEAPGLLHQITPFRELTDGEQRALVGELMLWHVWAVIERREPHWTVASEGLLAALHLGRRRFAGDDILCFIAMLLKPCETDAEPTLRGDTCGNTGERCEPA